MEYQKILTKIDLDNRIVFHFAKLLAEKCDNSDLIFLSAFLAYYNLVLGNISTNLKELAQTNLKDFFVFNEDEDLIDDVNYLFPEYTEWLAEFKKYDFIFTEQQQERALVVVSDNLYLQRYYQYEKRLAKNIAFRIKEENQSLDEELLERGVSQLFANSKETIDYQKLAAINSVKNKFSVISGGPGTGKTTTVYKIILLIIEQMLKKGIVPNLAMVAPTGKAAARLKESVDNAAKEIDYDDDVKRYVPDQAITIHKMLGAGYYTTKLKYNEKNLLPYNCIIVDESSMISLAFMEKLLVALKDETKIIFIGDKDQLASVEAGAVFGDVCNLEKVLTNEKKIDNRNNFINTLHKSYRFNENSGIKKLADFINNGNADEAIKILKDGQFNDLKFIETANYNFVYENILKECQDEYQQFRKSATIEDALVNFKKTMVLAPLRKGPFGIESLNLEIEKRIKRKYRLSQKEHYYHLKPLIITKNNHILKINNGDIALVWQNENSQKVYFEDLRSFAPVKVPENQNVYAMTIHKSQGSEFDKVCIVFPSNKNPLLTRELFYTALTRAKKEVVILGTEDVLKYCISRKIERKSELTTTIQNYL